MRLEGVLSSSPSAEIVIDIRQMCSFEKESHLWNFWVRVAIKYLLTRLPYMLLVNIRHFYPQSQSILFILINVFVENSEIRH